MATLSHAFTDTAAPGESSASHFVRAGQTITWTAVGTVDAGCEVAIQRQVGGGAWVDIERWQAGAINDAGAHKAEGGNQNLRFVAAVPTTDPATTLASFVATIADAAAVLDEVRNPAGARVFAVTDAGIEALKVTTDTIAEKTAAAGVTIDGLQIKDGQAYTDQINEKTSGAGVTVDGVAIKAGGATITTALQTPRSGVTGAITRGYGATAAEGLQEATIDETVDFADNVALHKELTYLFPANAVIISAQANIESALTGGGTTVKVGLGTAADPDAYGLSGALTLNAKIDTQPDAAVGFAAPLALRLSACAADGAAGDTALTVGSVRVRIVYRALVSLTDAA